MGWGGGQVFRKSVGEGFAGGGGVFLSLSAPELSPLSHLLQA